MKAADFIAKYLESRGVTHIFELSGGMITHLLDSISQQTTIRLVSMHHEQSAAFAVDGYARVTGIPGVAMATSGPGATNLLTGIGSCYFDSVPAVFITGQVNTHEQRGDRPIRQLGFQETDIVAMAEPVTKACFRVSKAADIPSILDRAFAIATEGRCGPVLIDLPMDVQRADIVVPVEPAHGTSLPISSALFGDPTVSDRTPPLPADIFDDIFTDIGNARRPLILAGRGIRAASAVGEFTHAVKVTNIPVIASLLGLDVLPYEDPLRAGFIGSYGNRWANIAFGEADFILVLGSRLDIRQTGADTRFFEGRKIYHVDCVEGEINNRIKDTIPVVADVKNFLRAFLDKAKGRIFPPKTEWLEHIQALREKWPDTKELETKGINPNGFMHILSRASRSAGSVLADVGTHQMWTAQSYELSEGQLFLTSAGMGAMGFSLPAAIGACLGSGKKPALVLVGDGCMQINLQELQTVYRNALPIKIVVLNNQHLGMIRQFQDSYFESRYQSTLWGYSAPDFAKVAEAFGIEARTISGEEEVRDAVEWLWAGPNPEKPQLLQVMIDPRANAYPKIAFGKPITEMEPFAKPVDMEGT